MRSILYLILLVAFCATSIRGSSKPDKAKSGPPRKKGNSSTSSKPLSLKEKRRFAEKEQEKIEKAEAAFKGRILDAANKLAPKHHVDLSQPDQLAQFWVHADKKMGGPTQPKPDGIASWALQEMSKERLKKLTASEPVCRKPQKVADKSEPAMPLQELDKRAKSPEGQGGKSPVSKGPTGYPEARRSVSRSSSDKVGSHGSRKGSTTPTIGGLTKRFDRFGLKDHGTRKWKRL